MPRKSRPRPIGQVIGRGVERQRLFDLVKQIERIAAFAVHLVDEGDDRNVAQPAHLEQLAGPRLDAFGGIDHHHGGIDRRQRAIGIFGKILVAGRVQQVEDQAAIFEGHHRGDDGNPALALDLHPVGAGVAPFALGPDLARHVDRAAEQQELFRQRGLAGIGMGDDGKGAPALHLGCEQRGCLLVGRNGFNGIGSCGEWRVHLAHVALGTGEYKHRAGRIRPPGSSKTILGKFRVWGHHNPRHRPAGVHAVLVA